MPVAQLVQHFESIDQIKMRRSSRMLFSSGRLSLRTMFRSHSRMSSASSSGAQTVSSIGSATFPTFSTESVDFLPASSAYTSPQSEHSPDSFSALSPHCEFPQRCVETTFKPVKIQRTFSSTSLALQSEYKVDQFEIPGLELFEPRPQNIFGSYQSAKEPAILDGIMEVMESG